VAGKTIPGNFVRARVKSYGADLAVQFERSTYLMLTRS